MGSLDLQEEIDITAWCIRLEPAAALSKELRSYQDSKGRIDFGNTDALNAYNKAAFKVMAGLEIVIPEGHLLPTACLRQAYITVLVDRLLTKKSKILEIGTGATAAIAMLAAKLYHMEVIATEIDPTSLKHARKNIHRNNLQGLVELRKSDGAVISGMLRDDTVDAVICYPPTYPEDDRREFQQDTTGQGFQGTAYEMIGGGSDGFSFIEQYLTEAVQEGIPIITTLLIFEEHKKLAVQQLQSLGLDPRSITLRVGTRIRYLVIAESSELSQVKGR